MNVAEKVATLEALLQRVQRNAAAPRTRARTTSSIELVAPRGAALDILDDAEDPALADAKLSAADATPPVVEAMASSIAQTPVPEGPPTPRPSEPNWDDVITAIDRTSPAADSPQLTALAAPLGTGPAKAMPATPAAGPVTRKAATPAAPAPAAAKAAPAATGAAKPAPAKTPAAPAAGRAAAPAGTSLRAAGDAPRAEAKDASAGAVEAARPVTSPEPKAKEAAKPAPAAKAGKPADAKPAQLKEKPSGPAAVPVARGSSPRVDAKPFFPVDEAPKTAGPPDHDSELSFAGLLPDEPEPTKPAPPAKPAERTAVAEVGAERKPAPERAETRAVAAAATSAKEGVAAKEPDAAKARPTASDDAPKTVPEAAKAAPEEATAARRVNDETTVERDLREVVDDEPTVIRGMLEDEPTVVRSRPEELEEEDTAIRSARSEARAVAGTVQDQETVEAASVANRAAAAAEEAERKAKPKAVGDSLPKVITKDPPTSAEPLQKESERITARPPADTITTERRKPSSGSTLRLALVAALLLASGGFVAYRSGWLGRSTTTPGAIPDAPTGTPQNLAPPSAAPSTESAAPSAEPSSTPTPTATAAPSAGASAAPEASASASAAAAEPAATTAPADTSAALPPNRGHLLVNSTAPAAVYINGSFAGSTGETLDVPCGTRNVRLGKPTTDKSAVPSWISEGQAVIIGCRKLTTVAMTPGESAAPTNDPPRRRREKPAADPGESPQPPPPLEPADPPPTPTEGAP